MAGLNVDKALATSGRWGSHRSQIRARREARLARSGNHKVTDPSVALSSPIPPFGRAPLRLTHSARAARRWWRPPVAVWFGDARMHAVPGVPVLGRCPLDRGKLRTLQTKPAVSTFSSGA
jgi:hypothetical protein